jgi:hypothetical protein
VPDSFEIQRQKDQASTDMVDDAMDKLEESRELNREHQARLLALDDDHFFDPPGRQLLRRVLDRYNTVADHLDETVHPAANAEPVVSGPGYRALGNGMHWNRQERSLYVKNGDHYVLYTRDRRKAGTPIGDGHAE